MTRTADGASLFANVRRLNKLAIDVRIKMTNAKQIDRALSRLPKGAERRVLSRAIRISLNVVLKEIRTAVMTGIPKMKAQERAKYAKQIRVDSIGRDTTGNITGKIRARDKLIDGNNWAKLAHLFEDGVDPHLIKQKNRTISHPGIKASNEWKRSWDKMETRMSNDFSDIVFGEITKEWAKL